MVCAIQMKYDELGSMMDERLKRHWAACEALALGYGGVSAVSQVTGLSRTTIRRGIAEIEGEMPTLAEEIANRVRRPGGGRRPLAATDATLHRDLAAMLSDSTRGDPMPTWMQSIFSETAFTVNGITLSARNNGLHLRCNMTKLFCYGALWEVYMAEMVIACYRPKANQSEAVSSLLSDHMSALRKKGLVTNREEYRARAGDGTLVEVFEWRSQEACDKAHEDAEIQNFWRRLAEVCDYCRVGDLEESGKAFAHFKSLKA